MAHASSVTPPRSVFHSFAALRSPSARGVGIGDTYAGSLTPTFSINSSPIAPFAETSVVKRGDTAFNEASAVEFCARDAVQSHNGRAQRLQEATVAVSNTQLDDDEALDPQTLETIYERMDNSHPPLAGRLSPSVNNTLSKMQQSQHKKEVMSYYDVDPVAVLQRLKAASASNGRRSDAQSTVSSTWHEPPINEPLVESMRGGRGVGAFRSASEHRTVFDPLDDDAARPSYTSGVFFGFSGASGGSGARARVIDSNFKSSGSSPKYHVEKLDTEGLVQRGGFSSGGASLDVDYTSLPTPSWLTPHRYEKVSALPLRPLPFTSVLSQNDVSLFRDEVEEAKMVAERGLLLGGAVLVDLPKGAGDSASTSRGVILGSGSPNLSVVAARAIVNGESNTMSPLPNNGDLALDLDEEHRTQQLEDLNLNLEDPEVARVRERALEKSALNSLRWRPEVSRKEPNQGVGQLSPSTQLNAVVQKRANVASPLAHFGYSEKASGRPPCIETVTVADLPATSTGAKGAGPASPAVAGKKAPPPPVPSAPPKGQVGKGIAAPPTPSAGKGPVAQPPSAESNAESMKTVVVIPPVPSVERPSLKQMEERATSLAYNPASYQDYLFEKYLQESLSSPLSFSGAEHHSTKPSGSPNRGAVSRYQQQTRDVLDKKELIATLHDPLRTGKFYDPFYSFRWWEIGADNNEVLLRGGVASAGPHPETGVMLFVDRFDNLTFGPYVLHPMRLWMVDYLSEKVTSLDDPILKTIDTLLVNNMANLWEVEKMLVKKYGVPNSYVTAPLSLKYNVVYPPESGLTFVPLTEAMSNDMLQRQKEIDEDARLQAERAQKSTSGDAPPSIESSPNSPVSPGGKVIKKSDGKDTKKGDDNPEKKSGTSDKKGDKPDKKGDKPDKKGDKPDKKEKKDKGGDEKKDKKGEKSDKKEKKDKGGDEKKDKGDKKEKKDKKK